MRKRAVNEDFPSRSDLLLRLVSDCVGTTEVPSNYLLSLRVRFLYPLFFGSLTYLSVTLKVN